MKSIVHIALASVIIAAVLAVSGSAYPVQAKVSTYCYINESGGGPLCGLSKEQCKDHGPIAYPSKDSCKKETG